MNHPGNLSIHDYSYTLPVEKIALHPLPDRAASKLLVYKNGTINTDTFGNIDQFINENSLLVYNDTQVINARLVFQKDSGKRIEIFCLEPMEDTNDYGQVMLKTGSVRWKCLVGGASGWHSEILQKKINLNNTVITLQARLIEKVPEAYTVELSWGDAYTFADILLHAGEVPLPPYIKRQIEKTDSERYQTIYASQQGSVAAPTAGLHFTEAVFNKLAQKKTERLSVTLHVSAGTFKPVNAETMLQHVMHAEWIDVELDTINKLASFKNQVIAVGTTSLRTLETLYWLGVKSIKDPFVNHLSLLQWEPYELDNENINVREALCGLVKWMKDRNIRRLITTTRLLIVPGYRFQVVHAIITNFHQPQSTLLLLVAAAVGEKWKCLYEYALDNGFRFLSYGDSSLIYIDQGLMVTDVPTGI